MTGNGSTDETLESESDFKPYDPTQEAIFPPELRLNSGQFNNQSLVFQGKKMSWLRPVLLDDLLTLKNANPGNNHPYEHLSFTLMCNTEALFTYKMI